MKALVCEMCNSNDIIKQDGFYVCQHCGTKYSPEEAKKMMIDGTVDVSGSTIKVDNSAFVERYLANARRAKQKEDWKETEKYYNMVEQNDPTNIEAIFYSSFAQVKLALLEKDSKEKRQNIFNILIKGVSVIDDNFDSTNPEHEKLLPVIMDDIEGLEKGTIVPTTHLAEYVTKNGYGNIVDRNQIVEDDPLSTTYAMIEEVIRAYLESLANIIVAHSTEAAKKVFIEYLGYLRLNSDLWEKVAPYIAGFKTPKQACDEIVKQVKIDDFETKESIDEQINNLGKTICPMLMEGDELMSGFANMVRNKLRELYPDSDALKVKKRGCYVATAVYGSYDCPEVWTLRRYRDDTLAKTWYGRSFIHTYYAISPTLVRWFGHTDWFRKMWKHRLDKMVGDLRSKGVEDTPYQDKKW